MGEKLPRSFYLNPDVVNVARQLIGKVLFTRISGVITSGIISESEAYAGVTDQASHAFGNRRTKRTGIMYGQGGHAYVYLCYGIHHLFNVVTHKEDVPHAVLIRGIIPCDGMEALQRRTGKSSIALTHFDGPGKLSKALGIRISDTGTDLTVRSRIWIEDREIELQDSEIETGPRIGVDYAGKDAMLPYRFCITSARQKMLLQCYSER